MAASKKKVSSAATRESLVRIGTWPTPEKPSPVAIDTVPLPDRPSIVVIRVGVSRAQEKRMASHPGHGTVFIDTVPLPDRPSHLIVTLFQTQGGVDVATMPLASRKRGRTNADKAVAGSDPPA